MRGEGVAVRSGVAFGRCRSDTATRQRTGADRPKPCPNQVAVALALTCAASIAADRSAWAWGTTMPDSSRMDQSATSPWGHKIRLSVYVKGDQAEAEHVADRLVAALDENEINSLPAVDFVGCMIEVEQESPRDQGAGELR